MSQRVCVFENNQPRVLEKPITVSCLNCGLLVTTHVFPIYAPCGEIQNAPVEFSCTHRLPLLDIQECGFCDKRPTSIYGCRKHGACTLHSSGIFESPLGSGTFINSQKFGASRVAICVTCEDRSAEPEIISGAVVSGMTSTFRSKSTLVSSLSSAGAAGFEPAIFRDQFESAFKTWKAALMCLASEQCQRLILFQDDISLCRGLRKYIEQLGWPGDAAVISLYSPESLPPTNTILQSGDGATWGACALMFTKESAIKILQTETLRDWPYDRGIDIAVGQACREIGRKHYYHRPSLVQHVGEVSAFGDDRRLSFGRKAADFVGEDFDAMSLLAAK